MKKKIHNAFQELLKIFKFKIKFNNKVKAKVKITIKFVVLTFQIINEKPRSGSTRRKLNLTRPLKPLNH